MTLTLELLLSHLPPHFLYPLVAAGGSGGSVVLTERGTCCTQEDPSLSLPRFSAPPAAAGTVLPVLRHGGHGPTPNLSASPQTHLASAEGTEKGIYFFAAVIYQQDNDVIYHLSLAQQWGSTGGQGDESLLVLGAAPCCSILPQTRQLQDLLPCAHRTG